MDNFVVLNTVIWIVVAFLLIAFAVFAIGFLVGYKTEELKILKRGQESYNIKIEESEQEKKAKKDWKNFLEYDGSSPDGIGDRR